MAISKQISIKKKDPIKIVIKIRINNLLCCTVTK